MRWVLQLRWCKRTWFLWCHTAHATNENSSRDLSFLIIHDSSSLKLRKVTDLHQAHCSSLSHTTSNSGHNHKACKAVSGSAQHQSPTGQSMIFLRTKFAFEGRSSRQARHIKFLTLLGRWSDQLPFHRAFSSPAWLSTSPISFSSFKKQYPDSQEYSPLYVNNQNRLSAPTTRDKGIFLMISTSSGVNPPSVSWLFHCHCRHQNFMMNSQLSDCSW